jgi:hypothetical protein
MMWSFGGTSIIVIGHNILLTNCKRRHHTNPLEIASFPQHHSFPAPQPRRGFLSLSLELTFHILPSSSEITSRLWSWIPPQMDQQVSSHFKGDCRLEDTVFWNVDSPLFICLLCTTTHKKPPWYGPNTLRQKDWDKRLAITNECAYLGAVPEDAGKLQPQLGKPILGRLNGTSHQTLVKKSQHNNLNLPIIYILKIWSFFVKMWNRKFISPAKYQHWERILDVTYNLPYPMWNKNLAGVLFSPLHLSWGLKA